MSSLPRDANGRILRRSQTVSTDLFDNKNAPATPALSGSLNIPSLTINGVSITQEVASKLNLAAGVTPGVASPDKALVLDSSKNISEVGTLRVESLFVGGEDILLAEGITDSVIDDAASPYMQGITPGVTTANKAIISNQDNEITGINVLALSNIKIGHLKYEEAPEINNLDYAIGDIYMPQFRDTFMLNLNTANTITTNSNFFSSVPAINIEYSEELDIYVALWGGSFLGSSAQNGMSWSSDGIKWTLCKIGTNALVFNQSRLWTMTYAPEIGVFLAYTFSTGAENVQYCSVLRSTDGKNWTEHPMLNTSNSVSSRLSNLCWNSTLRKFIAMGDFTVAESVDGLSWRFIETPNPMSTRTTTNLGQCVVYIPTSKQYIATTSHGDILQQDLDFAILYRSIDGISWYPIPAPVGSRGSGACAIAYSPHLNIIVASVAPGRPTNDQLNRIMLFSEDGGFTWQTTTARDSSSLLGSKIVWNSKLDMFIGYSTSGRVIYSFDGKAWHSRAAGAQATSTIYNDKTGKLISYATSTTITSPTVMHGNTTSYKVHVTHDSDKRARLSIKTPIESAMLTVGHESGRCLRIRPVSDFSNAEFNLQNGITKIKTQNLQLAPTIANNVSALILQTRPIWGYELRKLDDYFLKSNMLNNSPNYVAKTNANRGITLDGPISCSSASSNITDDLTSNNPLLNGSNAYNTVANKAITHINKELNISKLDCRHVQTNTAWIASDLEYATNITIDALEGFKVRNKSQLAWSGNFSSLSNNVTSASCTVIPSLRFVICWSATTLSHAFMRYDSSNSLSFQQYSPIDSANLTGTYRHVTWIPETNKTYISTSVGLFIINLINSRFVPFRCSIPQTNISITSNVAYSPELELYVAAADTYILYSRDGIHWARSTDTSFVLTNATIKNIVWVPWSGVFVALTSGSGRRDYMFYSRNGFEWNSSWENNNHIWLSNMLSMDISLEQRLILAINAATIIGSYDGITWFVVFSVSSGFTNIRYFDGIGWIVTGNATPFPTLTAMVSEDGLTWSTTTGISRIGSVGTTYAQIPGYDPYTNSLFFGLTGSSTLFTNYEFSRASTNNRSKYITPKEILTNPGRYIVDDANSRFGIDIQPSFALHLSRDAAFKPSTTTWSTSSDRRLKEDVTDADLQVCLDVVNNIPLKHYRWKKSVYSDDEICDRSQLGWLADDVELVLPKSVKKVKMHGYDDCRTLNNDQLIASMYGALKKLIEIDEDLDQYFIED